MTRKNIVDRVSFQVCLELESEFGPFTDFRFLAAELSARVKECLATPLRPLSEADREDRTQRVLRCVRDVLRETGLRLNMSRLGGEIDAALRSILGSARPFSARMLPALHASGGAL